ncbi:threonylcarbamoyl-AMP synthase [Candidatus Woesearchaeota archaeon]|nr:threonylcarbamoyl-AMP synthase [Candidatus Woesearchaeota archaeon]
MRVLTKEEFLMEKIFLFKKIVQDAVFIHPTDTIYGIGCNAESEEAVKKVREIKQRQDNPFSVIAPSKDWIMENCEVDEKAEEWIDKLPGAYTLILKLKNKDCIAESVNLGMGTLGVRIPEHWFGKVIEEFGKPIVTTSANVTGGNFMTSVDDIDSAIKLKLDFAVYEGEKKASPSEIIDLSKKGITRKKR